MIQMLAEYMEKNVEQFRDQEDFSLMSKEIQEIAKNVVCTNDFRCLGMAPLDIPKVERFIADSYLKVCNPTEHCSCNHFISFGSGLCNCPLRKYLYQHIEVFKNGSTEIGSNDRSTLI